MKYDPHKPYNQLPLLPPRKDLETKAILKKAIAAGRALAELKGIGSTIPNQTILVNTIALQEAKSSSEIENIVTTNDALFKAFSARSSHVDAATKEVLRYREALWEAFSTLKTAGHHDQPPHKACPDHQEEPGGDKKCTRHGNSQCFNRRGPICSA